MMCAPLIMFPFPSPGHRPFRFVLLCPPLRASGPHPRMVKRPDVEGVDLPSAQAVIVIPRATVFRDPLLSPETSYRLHLTFARVGDVESISTHLVSEGKRSVFPTVSSLVTVSCEQGVKVTMWSGGSTGTMRTVLESKRRPTCG